MKSADVIPLPGVKLPPKKKKKKRAKKAPKPKKVVLKYRVAVVDVPAPWIDGTAAGRLDAAEMTAERFGNFMKVITATRAVAFGLEFDVYSGSDCALVRRELAVLKPSEIVLAIRGAGLDPWWKTRAPTLAQIFAKASVFVALAKAPERVAMAPTQRKGELEARARVLLVALRSRSLISADALGLRVESLAVSGFSTPEAWNQLVIDIERECERTGADL